MKKAQGLPMSTIVLIIIVIVVLAVVVLFFYMYFTKGTGGVDVFQCQQYCESAKAIYEDTDIWPPVSTHPYCTEGCDDLGLVCKAEDNSIYACE